ncbi:MAG TPA: sulfatase-like hydrolase/transferase [Acidimicrobiales bacterium]|nr:sulfatase-like hydrolase/transferase [Acidimicrobiales bacterium]
MAVSAPRPPDILYVVLDCARATDLNSGPTSRERYPNWARLTGSSLVFDHAIAPASWTLPSHASMFTGKYPWEHLVLHGGTPVLGAEFVTLADETRRLGYATACFSANPLVGRSTGLVRGFDTAYSGRFLDCYLRPLSSHLTGPVSEHEHGRSSLLKRIETETGHTLRSSVKKALLLYPAIFDLFVRAAAKVRSERDGLPSEASPWIEPTLSSWLDSVDPSRPCFAFVNLLDAHEPYLALPERIDSWTEWFARMSVRQDSLQQFFGTRMPSEDDCAVLYELYQEALRIADRRLGQIVDRFERVRDPANTIVVVTSDHGQAFGEGGQVYHGRGTTDEIVRVPLAVRFPERLGLHGVVPDWTSTAMLGPAVLLPSIWETSGPQRPAPYGAAKDEAGTEPVFAISDNYDSPEQFERSPTPFSGSLVAYRGSVKVELKLPDHRLRAFDEDQPGRPEVALEQKNRSTQQVVEQLKRIASSHLKELTPMRNPAWARLAAWGYDS